MRFLHISDLHLGKYLLEFSLIDEQKFILDKIFDIVDNQNIDAVLIAGDVYDRSIPSLEAVKLFENFIIKLSDNNISVFIIAGNHDSAGRLEYGKTFFRDSKIFIAGEYDGTIPSFSFYENNLEIKIHLLPFVRPIHVKKFFDSSDITNTNSAIKTALENADLCSGVNIVLCHQFVVSGETKPKTSDSENVYVGTSDDVESSVFDKFDYVALGHLHRAQHIGRENVRYSGSILKYSASETLNKKSAVIIDISENGVAIQTEELSAQSDVRCIKGDLENLLLTAKTDENPNDFMFVTLTDRHVINAAQKLRNIYPNLLNVSFETFAGAGVNHINEGLKRKTNFELFEDFYKYIHDNEMIENESKIVKTAFQNIESEESEQ